MLLGAIILFLVVVIFGIVMLTSYLGGSGINNRVALLHGVFAAAALVLVISYTVLNGFPTPLVISSVLFIMAALGGLTLASLGKKNKPLPKLILVVHPIVAITGLIFLVFYFLP